MGGKWQNVDAGPRQVKDLQHAIYELRSEGQARTELYGVIGGEERSSVTIAMMGPVRAEVAALIDEIGERYAWQVTRANVRQIIADHEAALPQARESRPTEDNRRTPEEEAERAAAQAKRDAGYQAAQQAQDTIMAQVMAKAPKDAKGLIYAEYHVDDSDPMTDYFNSKTARTVAIGFRSSSREDFRALHAAAARFAETAGTAFDEHRDNYSMGAGNYLSDHGGAHSGTGWVIRSRAFPCKYVSLTEEAIPEQPEAPARGTSSPRSRAISADVMTVLGSAEADGNALRMTARLDRASYVAVNAVLEAAGGKWNRKARAHLFPGDAGEVLAGLISEGEYTRPADEGWFPTPPQIVELMLDMAGVEEGTEVLEPSAGEGAIAKAAAARGAIVTCIELNAKRAEVLRSAGFAHLVSAGDFLATDLAVGEPVYDAVVMNPPFAGKADVAHVQHAAGFVRPGGLVVAIMSAGTAFRDDRVTAGFRELVQRSGGSIKPLPDGTFHEAGTDVRTVLVTLPVAVERSQVA